MKRALALLVLVLAVGSAITAASATGETVRVANYAFRPKAVTVQKGDKVTWKGVRGTHTVNFNRSPFGQRRFYRRIEQGERLSKRARRRGSFRYHCTFHSGMRGKVIVK